MVAAQPKITTLGTAVDLTDPSVNPQAAPTSTPRQGGFTLRNRVNFTNVSASNKAAMTVNNVAMTTLPAVPFYILEVPERTYVKDLTLFAVEGETVPGFSMSNVSSPTNSDFDSMTWSFGAHRNRKDVTNASYSAATDLVHITTVPANQACAVGGVIAGDVFGNLDVKVNTNNLVWIDLFDAIDGSLATSAEPMQTAKMIRNRGASALGSSGADVLQQNEGEYFPYGGYVSMRFGPFNASMDASDAAVVTDYYAASVGTVFSLAGTWEVQANCMYVPE